MLYIVWFSKTANIFSRSFYFKLQRIQANIQTVDLSEQEIKEINDISKTTTKRFVRPAWGIPVFDEDFE